MDNVLSRDNNKFILIGKIKGLAGESKRTRQRIITAKSEAAADTFAYRKRIIGVDIRHHLLAYAFLKGIPYSKLEKVCRDKPQVELILQVIAAHIPRFIHYKIENINYWHKSKSLTADDVKNWLNGQAIKLY